MVTIITGKINSGKSTTIAKLYRLKQQGDGFISIKSMHYDKVHSYDIMKLSNQQTKLFVLREEYIENQEAACKIGPYVFLKETFDYVENEIDLMIKTNVSPIFLDEIGQLELYDQCFHAIFKRILANNIDCVITVREDLVEKVVKKYNINEVEIMTL